MGAQATPTLSSKIEPKAAAIPALDFESSFPYQVFSVQRGKAFWFHRRDRSCSDKNKPFSLSTDQTFLFLTEETLSGSPKETRPVLIITNLLLFPQTKPLFFSRNKRFLVPPKRHVVFCTKTKLLLFPETNPCFSFQKKRLLVPPKRRVLSSSASPTE